MTIISEAYYKCVIALVLALASVVNYYCKGHSKLCRHLRSSLTIVIYNRNMFIIQGTRNTNGGGRHNRVDLKIKVACLVKKGK